MIPTIEKLHESIKQELDKAPEYKKFHLLMELCTISGMDYQLDKTVNFVTNIFERMELVKNAQTSTEKDELLDKIVVSMGIFIACLSEEKDSMIEESDEILKQITPGSLLG